MRKSFTLIDWLIVFSALLAVLAMFRGTVKRTVESKARAVGDFMIWNHWGDGTDSVPRDSDGTGWFQSDKNTQSKTATKQAQAQTTLETRDGSVNSTITQTRASRSVSVGVGKDQEYLLSNDTINRLKVNVDVSGD